MRAIDSLICPQLIAFPVIASVCDAVRIVNEAPFSGASLSRKECSCMNGSI